MWPDWLKPDLLKAIQLKPRYLFGVFSLGILILFLHEDFAKTFGLFQLRESYRGYIGFGTLAAFVFWLIQISAKWLENVKGNKRKFERQEEVLQNLKTLSDNEELIIIYCFYNGQTTIFLNVTSAEANSLCAKGLLQLGAKQGHMLNYPFTIPSFVWTHINVFRPDFLSDSALENPELIRSLKREFE